MDKTPQELYQERAKRVEDAIQLKVPDRVPTMLSLSFFPAKYAGVTCKDAYYNPPKWNAAVKKTVFELEPDLYMPVLLTPGPALEALDHKQMLWPGHGVSPNHTFQFVEGEYMRADEYDTFLEDPSDFLIRTYLPRIYGSLESLRELPHLTVLLSGVTSIIGMSVLDGAIAALSKARQEILQWNQETETLEQEIEDKGFPLYYTVVVQAPFDTISDRLRGMRGSMLDMYRQPDKLLKTCERLLPIILRSAIARAEATGNPRIFIPLHRGAEGFMSLKQFETFYWPTLKGLILGLIDAGLTPSPFFEGDYVSRLEYLLELPKGKVLGYFDTSDMQKVKEVVGKTMCIMGNVPSSLLQTGTQQDIKDYCRMLIDVVGPGGGFILAPRSALDEAKPENVKTMLDFTKEYGVYK